MNKSHIVSVVVNVNVIREHRVEIVGRGDYVTARRLSEHFYSPSSSIPSNPLNNATTTTIATAHVQPFSEMLTSG